MRTLHPYRSFSKSSSRMLPSVSSMYTCVAKVTHTLSANRHTHLRTSQVTRTRKTHKSHKQTSNVTPPTSHVTCHMSHITHHTSHVTHHTSHITRHTSHVINQTSPTTHTRPHTRRCPTPPTSLPHTAPLPGTHLIRVSILLLLLHLLLHVFHERVFRVSDDKLMRVTSSTAEMSVGVWGLGFGVWGLGCRRWGDVPFWRR